MRTELSLEMRWNPASVSHSISLLSGYDQKRDLKRFAVAWDARSYAFQVFRNVSLSRSRNPRVTSSANSQSRNVLLCKVSPFSLLCRCATKGSIERLKSKGESGSPCLTPDLIWIGGSGPLVPKIRAVLWWYSAEIAVCNFWGRENLAKTALRYLWLTLS